MNNPRPQVVEECFHLLRSSLTEQIGQGDKIKWGCHQEKIDNCVCSSHSEYIYSINLKTFNHDLEKLAEKTNYFKSIQAETWLNNLYISYSCKNIENYKMEEEFDQDEN